MIEKLQEQLRMGKKILMDGAMGTEIQRRGVKTTLPLWSAGCLLSNPDIVREIHADYIKAGAQICITNTFRTTNHTFAKVKLSSRSAKKATLLACRLVRDAIASVSPFHKVYVAGSMAPLEDCYSPELTPSQDVLEKEHLVNATNLKEGNVDFILLETMITQREVLAACRAAQKVNLPLAVSFCCNSQGQLLGGEELRVVAQKVLEYKPIFLGINCVAVETVLPNIKILRSITSGALAAYAQGYGRADDNEGWVFTGNNNPQTYLEYARLWAKNLVQIIGGCCGTTPDYIKMLNQALDKQN